MSVILELPVPTAWMALTSPWFPLAASAVLAFGRAPGTYPPTFQHWMLWHHAFLLPARKNNPPSRADAPAPGAW